MRLHRMFGPLLGTLAAIAGVETVSAQQPYGPGPGMSGAAAIDGSGGYFQVPGAGAYPSYYQPYPAVSPYEMDYGQTAVENGLWQYDNMSDAGMPAHWRFKSEYVRTRVRNARGFVGNPDARTYKEQVLPLLRQAPYNLTTVADTFQGVNGNPGFNYFDPVYADSMEQPDLNGVRFTLEALNAEGSGLEFVGLWNDGNGEFNARDYTPSEQGIPNLVYNSERFKLLQFYDEGQILNAPPGGVSNVVVFQPVRTSGGNQQGGNANNGTIEIPIGRFQDYSQALAVTLKNLRGIPLDDGTVQIGADGKPFGGASAVYDLDFKLNYNVQQYGFGMRWNTAPWYKTNSFRLTPMVGVRYVNLREDFSFLGHHSGLIYDNLTGNVAPNPDVLLHSIPDNVDNNSDTLIDPAGAIEGGTQQGGGGGGGGGGGTGTGRFIYPATNQIYPITSWLRSQVDSNLIGPEVGVSYVWGGEKIHLGGRTNVSLMANIERMNLSGDNIFVTTRQSNLNVPTVNDPKPNDFASDRDSSHVSPMLEQSFYFDGPFLRYVPLIRRAAIARNANVSFGYTYTLIGEVTRPDQSIVWQGNPSINLYPAIRPERTNWHSDSFNFGLSWSW